MASIDKQLKSINSGDSKKIRGITINRDGDYYLIDGEFYDLDSAKNVIRQSGTKRQKFPYDDVAFLLVEPPKRRVLSTHRIRNRKEHTDLLELAKKKKCLIYYAGVICEDGKYYASHHWAIDWESADNLFGSNEDKQSENINELKCPYCNKSMTSTPGRTLHVKSKHPERYQDYMANK